MVDLRSGGGLPPPDQDEVYPILYRIQGFEGSRIQDFPLIPSLNKEGTQGWLINVTNKFVSSSFNLLSSVDYLPLIPSLNQEGTQGWLINVTNKLVSHPFDPLYPLTEFVYVQIGD